MVKQSYDDPVKQKWRESWYQFIKKSRHFLKSEPSSWNVAFFPGEEALELNVYDRLGIPRKNLLGLEKYAKEHGVLKKKDLGIRLTDKPMDAKDFFEQTDERFDIINLDYKGHFNWDVMSTIETIQKKSTLEDNALLGITNYNKREQKKLSKFLNLNLIEKLTEREELIEIAEKYYEFDDVGFLKKKGYEKKQVKINSISREIKKRMLIPFFLEFDKVRAPLTKALLDNMEIIEENGHSLEDAIKEVEDIVYLAIKSKLKPSFLKDSEKYKYTGKNSSLMFSDFHRFSRDSPSLKKYEAIINFSAEQLDPIKVVECILERKTRSVKDVKKMGRIVERDMYVNSWEDPSSERINLGSSAKLPKLIGKEYYAQRYADDEKGVSIGKTHDRLIETFKTTREQLPRFEAHYTMETHGPKYILSTTSEDEVPRESLEKIISIKKNQIISPRNWRRLSENKQKRISYFINEDLSRLNFGQEGLNQFAQEIRTSKWYEKLNEEGVSDFQFYAFFDDLLLKSIDGKVPNKKDVEKIVKNVYGANWKNNWPHKFSSKSASAEVSTEDRKQDVNMGYEIISMLRDGKSKEDVMRTWDVDKGQLAGYLAANKRGAYRHLFEASAPSVYVDSRGVVHRDTKKISDIKKGYR